MAAQNKSIIISDDELFIENYSRHCTNSNYVVRHAGMPKDWNKFHSFDQADCYIVDNRDGKFPFEKFAFSLDGQSPQLFIINVGEKPSRNLKISPLIFTVNPAMNEIPLSLFLENASIVLRRDKAQSELANMVLHDVRSPLNSLIGYLELLLNNTFGPLNEGQKSILEKAMDMGDSTLDLLEDLNEIFRREQSTFLLQKEPFYFEELLETVLVNIWVKADHKNIKIKKDVAADLREISGDDYQIQRVLTNLLTNAIKYAPPHSTITIRAMERTESIAEISIIDNGQGVAEEQLPHLFDKFFRVKQAQQVEKGFGLGLYISKIIVKAHHGKIWAENNKLGGLTVSFTLPLVKK